jgi:hypothetical protein
MTTTTSTTDTTSTDTDTTDTSTTDTSTTDTTGTDTDTDDEPLGAAGTKALEAMKKRAREAEAKARLADKLAAENQALREAAMSEQERAVEQARREAEERVRAELTVATNERLFASELRAAVVGKISDADLFADPLVAQRLLGLEAIPVTEAGDIDTEAISVAVESFLDAKPHLRASAKRPPSTDQGHRRRPDSIDPASLTDAKDVREWAKSNRRNSF